MVANLWNDSEAHRFATDLEQRVYSSRLLGQDPTLVMHGGGNTSVKADVTNLVGEKEAVIYVKGSGWDLATIEAQGFAPVRMAHLLKLRQLDKLSDPEMVNELKTQLVDHKAPGPSVETLLHAFLPHKFIDHTHADAVLTLTNQPGGEGLIKELYGNKVAIVPYVMPGFALAKLCADIYDQNPQVEAMVLLKHGVFTFGETAKESYDRMITVVSAAEEAVAKSSPSSKTPELKVSEDLAGWWMTAIRSELQRRGAPAVLKRNSSHAALAFCGRDDLSNLATRGPLTPDHIIRTKQFPLVMSAAAVERKDPEALNQALDSFEKSYRAYFAKGAKRYDGLTMLDPFPRVVLLPGVGVISIGATLKAAKIVDDIYAHTMPVITNAEAMSSYDALPVADLFDMEYWVLEQAKLKKGPSQAALTGKVAVISGAASGIGLGIAKGLAGAGAIVVGLDLAEKVTEVFAENVGPLAKSGNGALGLVCDVSQPDSVAEAFRQVKATFGGIDIAVINAGIFPPSQSLAELSAETWEKSLAVNATGTMTLLQQSMAAFTAQQTGGDIVVIASKNVPAPGKKAAAYSAAKAAQTQLARVAALEGASLGVRINTLHPHLVMDTGIWSEEVIAKRAEAYGLTPEQYKTNNLLQTPLTSQDVAQAVLRLVDGSFGKTTGAQIPVDGGSDRTL